MQNKKVYAIINTEYKYPTEDIGYKIKYRIYEKQKRGRRVWSS